MKPTSLETISNDFDTIISIDLNQRGWSNVTQGVTTFNTFDCSIIYKTENM